MARVNDLLERKSGEVQTAEEATTVLDATNRMTEHQVGCLVVMRGEQIVGIFTERDVLRRVVAERLDPAETTLNQVMSTELIVCTPDTAIEQVRAIMMQRRIRHLPVVDHEGKLVGIISIGDLNSHKLKDVQITVQYLHEYIHGRA